MNCEAVADKLSPLIDGELGPHEEREVQQHLDACPGCRRQLKQFIAIGELMRRSEPSDEIVPAWETIEGQLDRRTVVQLSPRFSTSRWAFTALATAASIGLLWFAFNGLQSGNHRSGHSHDAIAVDFEDVVAHAQTAPMTAIAKLVAKYEGKELDRDATIAYLGYEPASFKRLPQGFDRTSTHVLNMPCCKCSATICRRGDGTSLVIFEHKEEQRVWFGDAPCIETQCAGQPCKIIQSLGNLAVTWKNKDRQLTMIGAKDREEIEQWSRRSKCSFC